MPKKFILDPPEGFQGLDWKREIHRYRRNLPHWRQAEATYFVTFRLADSLPREALEQISETREQWEAKNGKPQSEHEWMEYAKAVTVEEERWLDKGCGNCLLKDRKYADIVIAKLTKFDLERYQLGAYVIIPNHVHLVVRPFEEFELDEIMKGWKGVSSREINRLSGSVGKVLWQDESYDSIVRDVGHLFSIVQYIGNNPDKAGLKNCPRWICKDWIEMGYGFRDAP